MNAIAVGIGGLMSRGRATLVNEWVRPIRSAYCKRVRVNRPEHMGGRFNISKAHLCY